MKTLDVGINEDVVRKISHLKKEPSWMTEFRVKAYKKFSKLSNPNFGPELKINFDEIHYYKKVSDVKNKWEDVPKDIKDTFDKIGIPEAEQKYLAGVSTQYES